MNGRQPIVRLTPATKRTTRVITVQSKIFPSFFITPPGDLTRASSNLEAGDITFLGRPRKAAGVWTLSDLPVCPNTGYQPFLVLLFALVFLTRRDWLTRHGRCCLRTLGFLRLGRSVDSRSFRFGFGCNWGSGGLSFSLLLARSRGSSHRGCRRCSSGRFSRGSLGGPSTA